MLIEIDVHLDCAVNCHKISTEHIAVPYTNAASAQWDTSRLRQSWYRLSSVSFIVIVNFELVNLLEGP